MGGRHYLPRGDGAFDGWQRNYCGYAKANEAALGLAANDVEKLGSLSAAWEAAYAEATAARDAWQSAAAAKEQRRAELAALVRQLAAQVRANASVSEAQRLALGLTAADENAAPAGPPTTAPRFTIDAAQRLRHSLWFADGESADRRAKPDGIFAAEVYVALRPHGAPAPSDLDAYLFRGAFTRTPARLTYEGAAGGMTAHYQLRWINTRAQPGPVSAIVSATVGG